MPTPLELKLFDCLQPLPLTDLLDTLSETKYEYYVEAKIGQNASRAGGRVFALGRTKNMLNHYSWSLQWDRQEDVQYVYWSVSIDPSNVMDHGMLHVFTENHA